MKRETNFSLASDLVQLAQRISAGRFPIRGEQSVDADKKLTQRARFDRPNLS